jgi:hypothetical protein
MHAAWNLTGHITVVDNRDEYDTYSLRMVAHSIALRYPLLLDAPCGATALAWKRASLSMRWEAKAYTSFFKELEDLWYASLQDASEDPLSLTSGGIHDILLRFQHEAGWRSTLRCLSRITLSLMEALVDVPLPSAIYWFSTWAVFSNRLTLDVAGLEAKAIQDYKAHEAALLEWEYPDCSDLAAIWQEWFHRYSEKPFLPAHGPGATYELPRDASASLRYERMLVPDHIAYKLWLADFPLPPRATRVDDDEARRCRLILVPKSSTKRRTISAEPICNQWYQHAVARSMQSCMDAATTCHIALRDQSLSRDMAITGSVSGEYVTIDLSNASDSVTLSLVTRVCAGCPDLLDDLIACRSSECELPTGEVLSLGKFAPMGSSTCFPVESCIFGALCESVVRDATGRRSRRMDWRVYGDDIIIRRRYAAALLEKLELFHFTVNARKTFTQEGVSCFREACGVEAYNGYDVTPLRMSRRWRICGDGNDSRARLDVVLPNAAAANAAYQHGCTSLRRAYLDQLRRELGERYYKIGRVTVDTVTTLPHLYADADVCTNYAVRTREGSYLHGKWTSLYSTEYKLCYARVRSDPPDGAELGCSALYAWFVDSLSRTSSSSEIPTGRQIQLYDDRSLRGQKLAWGERWCQQHPRVP